jgi:cytochrome c biogenesis protein CcmG/thiol:disulfide interchange protein DsbE
MRFIIPVVVLVGLLALFIVGLQHDPREVPSPLIGKAAPAFDLPTVSGAPPRMTERDLRGKPVLVNFFASWCADCQVEHPLLMQLATQGGVKLVGIDYKDEKFDLQPWLASHGDPYQTILSDLDGKTGMDWGVYGVPETFVVGADGTILYKQIGAVTPEAWNTKIQPLLDTPG